MSTSNRIVFQGEPGANSHIACHQAYPDYQAVPCPTFEDAFAAVETGEAALGMIPIENSVAGRVADIHHLMPTSGLHIVAEWFLPIRHQLMAPKGAKLDDIRSVESHVKALGRFATNGINMTKLESYMIEGNFFATQFYADVEGHPDDRSLALALEELAFFSKELKILGVYPAHPFRATFEEQM